MESQCISDDHSHVRLMFPSKSMYGAMKEDCQEKHRWRKDQAGKERLRCSSLRGEIIVTGIVSRDENFGKEEKNSVIKNILSQNDQ